ncbi:MAG: VanZ family protein [Oscillospiraceae bacterium]|nr:VanZ family protein [Oscillospiraceae bacterium]
MSSTARTHSRYWLTLWIAVSLAVAVLIFCFSSQPASESGTISRGMLRWLLSLVGYTPEQLPETLHHYLRKAAHFTIYALLGFCLRGAFDAQTRVPPLPCSIGAAALYAMSDEFHQSFVPGRGPQLSDVLLDTAGAALGVLMMTLLLHLLSLWRRRSKPLP